MQFEREGDALQRAAALGCFLAGVDYCATTQRSPLPEGLVKTTAYAILDTGPYPDVEAMERRCSQFFDRLRIAHPIRLPFDESEVNDFIRAEAKVGKPLDSKEEPSGVTLPRDPELERLLREADLWGIG